MEIYLQHQQTLYFLSAEGTWVDTTAGALVFLSYMQAKDFAQMHGVGKVSVLFRFSSPRYDFRLPLLIGHQKPNDQTS